MVVRISTILSDVSCASLDKDSVDVVVCSPPYKDGDGYSESLMVSLRGLCERALKPGGRMFVNFGQLSGAFSRPFEVHRILSDGALRSAQTIIWAKSISIANRQIGHFQPINSKRLLNYSFEYIFHFYKPPEAPLDRLSIGTAYADKSNLSRGTRGKNGDVHCSGDIWFIPYETIGKTRKKTHPHEYPAELVRRCIKLSGVKKGAVVLDPFCGSGQTSCVAKSLGMNAITIDIDPDALSCAKSRWSNA